MARTTVPTPRVSQQAFCHGKSKRQSVVHFKSRRASICEDRRTAIGGDLEYFLMYMLIREPYVEVVATRGAARVWGVSGALPPFK